MSETVESDKMVKNRGEKIADNDALAPERAVIGGDSAENGGGARNLANWPPGAGGAAKTENRVVENSVRKPADSSSRFDPAAAEMTVAEAEEKGHLRTKEPIEIAEPGVEIVENAICQKAPPGARLAYKPTGRDLMAEETIDVKEKAEPAEEPAEVQPFLLAPTVEEAVLADSDDFLKLAAVEQRFVVGYLRVMERAAKGEVKKFSVDQVAEVSGVARTKCYQLLRQPVIWISIRQGAQRFGDLGAVWGSRGHDVAARKIFEGLASGERNPWELTMVELHILRDCKQMMGLLPGVQARGAVVRDASGRSVSTWTAGAPTGGVAGAVDTTDALDIAMALADAAERADLKAAQALEDGVEAEAETAECEEGEVGCKTAAKGGCDGGGG